MTAPRQKSRESVLAALGVALALAVVLAAAPAFGQATGGISGRVTDSNSGAPMGYTNVAVLGTPYGAMTNPQGYFEIDFVPVGTYVVKATFISYADQSVSDVVVEADRTTQVSFSMREEALVAEEVVVEAERPMIETESTTTRRGMDQEEVKIRPINTVQEAIATQPGVVLHEGEIHVRGGRSTEVKMYVDGMAITNSATGTSNLEVSLSSLSEFELLSGGFDAEYGNVQSGVINLQTREGGRQFSGEIKYMTDDYGAPERTYDNFDNVSFGMGGPFFTDKLRYYFSGEGRFSDTYLKTGEERETHQLFGESVGLDVRERQSMLGSGQAKFSFFVTPTQKLTAEFLTSVTKRDFYSHAYSREGYWSPASEMFYNVDGNPATNDSTAGYDDWSHVPLDSTYQYYNAAEHTPTQRTRFSQRKLVWRDNVSPTTFYTVKVAQFESNEKFWLHEHPNDYWWEVYVGNATTTDLDSDNDLNTETGYYRTWGDNLGWRHNITKATTFKADLTNQPSDTHQLKTGVEAVYNELDVTELSLGSLIPSETQMDAEGFTFFNWDRARYTDERSFHNIYKAFPTNGAMYLQDRMRYEGMIVRAGLRLDWSDPGPASGVGERQIWRERIKAVLSPRLGIAHPISDRDALHFHYGRFYQMPNLTAFYQANEELSAATSGRIIGSSGLEPEVTVSYQFGAEHQFSQNVAMDVTGFYKDIFGLLATEEFEGEALTGTWYPYVNKDYATVRGIEFKLSKRFSNYFSGNMTYTWLQATGVSSDPNAGAYTAAEGIQQPLREIPLDWDERDTVTGFLFVSDPGNWEMTFDYNYGSGTPYTPTFVGVKEILPETINSKRLPSHQVLNLRGTKKYKLYGQEFRLFFEALNVFDKRNLAGLGNYGAEYYTETGNLGGAYLETVGENQVLEPLNDPSVFSEGRLIRIGIAIDW